MHSSISSLVGKLDKLILYTDKEDPPSHHKSTFSRFLFSFSRVKLHGAEVRFPGKNDKKAIDQEQILSEIKSLKILRISLKNTPSIFPSSQAHPDLIRVLKNRSQLEQLEIINQHPGEFLDLSDKQARHIKDAFSEPNLNFPALKKARFCITFILGSTISLNLLKSLTANQLRSLELEFENDFSRYVEDKCIKYKVDTKDKIHKFIGSLKDLTFPRLKHFAWKYDKPLLLEDFTHLITLPWSITQFSYKSAEGMYASEIFAKTCSWHLKSLSTTLSREKTKNHEIVKSFIANLKTAKWTTQLQECHLYNIKNIDFEESLRSIFK